MILGLSLLLLCIGLYALFLSHTNRTYLKQLSTHKGPDQTDTLVTVAIPARNEEKTIERCVRSLLASTYPKLEILVLDDNSSDATAAIVAGLAQEDERVCLIKGKELVPGWRGKLFAMQQLLEKANGSVLLFTDADTYHEPGSVSYGLALLEQEKATMLSGYPKQQCKTLGIELLVSAMLFNPTIFVPFFLQKRHHLSSFSMAIGQYLMIRTDDLKEMGGFFPIRTEICDDVSLARHCTRSKKQYLFAPLQAHVQCEMYPTFPTAWQGLSRSINGVVKQGFLGMLMILAIVLVLLVLAFSPFLALTLLVMTIQDSSFLLPFLFSTVGSIALALGWKVSADYFGFSPKAGKLGLLTIFFVVLLYLYGLWLRFTGRGFVWKGRTIL